MPSRPEPRDGSPHDPACIAPGAAHRRAIRAGVAAALGALRPVGLMPLSVICLGERFGNSPEKLVQAIQRKGLPDGDANTFCNNVAWVLRGERASAASERGDARRATFGD